MLDGDAGMRPLVGHSRDDADLVIAPLDRADPGGATQRRVLAVGRCDQPGAQARSVVERDFGGGLGRAPIGDAAPADQSKARQRARPVEEDAAQDPVLDDVAERHAHRRCCGISSRQS